VLVVKSRAGSPNDCEGNLVERLRKGGKDGEWVSSDEAVVFVTRVANFAKTSFDDEAPRWR
jgi:hypothetical protein